MPYITQSGVSIPQGPDAFTPAAQYKGWADAEAVYDNFFNVALDSDRTSLAAPQLRDGIFCWVRATQTLWSYQGTSWVNMLNDTGWATPTLQNSWVNFGAPYRNCAYRRINGIVYVEGLLKSGTATANTVVFNLPAGFRPSASLFFGTQSNSAMATVQLAASGDLTLSAGVSALSLTLMFSFIAEA